MVDLVGRTLDRYRIVSRLGRGGMAEVYKAYQPGMDRYVAIKVMLGHMVDDPEFVSRFEREALNVGKLRHPNIVQAYDFAHEQGIYFMVMEFIDGPTLKDEIRARKSAQKSFTSNEVARVFTALCNAIDYAHARSMVHRDVKPANVMINQDGQVVLTDFGIVRTMGATQHTATGAMTGTPAYMSPEQGKGERADERSDIYALGIMLYEIVTGEVPYDADTPFGVIMQHINHPLPLPRKVNPDISEDIEKIILKTLSKNPDDRYQTAGALAKAVQDAVGITFAEINKPLETVATAPKTDDVAHATGPITAAERAATVAALGGRATVVSTSDLEQTVASTSPDTAGTGKLPFLPIIIGGGAILIIAVVVGLFAFSNSRSNQANMTATAEVEGTSAALAQQEQENQAQTATAETNVSVLDPTDTPVPATATPVPPGTPQAMAKQDLEVRAGPNETYALLGYLPNGATVEIISRDQSGEWWQVKTSLSAGVGWIRAGEEFSDAEDTGSVPIALAPPTVTPTSTATEPSSPTPTDEPLTPTPSPTPSPTTMDTPEPVATNTPGPPTDTPTPVPPTNTPTPDRPQITGKLAFPVDDGAGAYNVHIVSLPAGDRLGLIKGARQPDFRGDGVKLLVNGQGGGFGENVFEATPGGAIERPVSDSPTDSHPVYNPDGNRIAYGNPLLAIGADGDFHPYIFVQCGIIPPNQEADDQCRDVARFGIIVPAGAIGEVQGSNPVWTATDQIIYKGCNTWAGGGRCGAFVVASWGNKKNSGGETPRMIADGTSLTPTDTNGNLVAYHSRQSGDWEAYVMDLSGAGAVNLSNNPTAADGVPTLSPDGSSVIFASNRDGRWAFYVVPVTGGTATKLFDFPKANPWATGDREWTNERISWGP